MKLNWNFLGEGGQNEKPSAGGSVGDLGMFLPRICKFNDSERSCN